MSGNYASHNGAGILNARSGTVTVERSTITGNTSESDGGGIYTKGGTLTVTDSTIARNKAGGGAGIYSAGAPSTSGLRGRVDLTDSTFSENTAAASGGGVFNEGEAQLTLTDVALRDNTAGDSGGGLSNHGSTTLIVRGTTFTSNEALGEGGGAWTGTQRQATIKDSTFSGNTAGSTDPEGNVAGGGGLFTENGPVTITGSTFNDNVASEEGGGISIDNFGAVKISDSVVRNNRSHDNGGGIENSGANVTFERLTVKDNRATLDGGGIYNSSSGEFTVLDTTVQNNHATSGGGFTNASDSTLIIRGSLFLGNSAKRPRGIEDVENGGRGGGIYSISDGDGLIENTTVSGNTANVSGGGMFHDADAALKLVHVTFWRNSAPTGGGISTVESDFVPSVPPQPNPLSLKNTIVGGSLQGGSCDAMLTSEGGNLDSGTGCNLQGPKDRSNSNPALDAIADNGGPTLTHALRGDSIAVDHGVSPCSQYDARGVPRPQNRGCDSGAFEFEGTPPPPDEVPPDTEYLSGPIQDTLETMAFRFTGSDNATQESELAFECRLLEIELTEPPEPVSPFDPLDPELRFVPCASPWQVPLTEEGLFTFEVRAIDRAGNTDPTPAVHTFSGLDTTPPDTVIAEKPPNPSNGRSATFTFTGTDNLTPPEFLEFECRIDSRDPEMWLECLNPTFYSNLTTGTHTVEVRALDGAENIDPTPARYTWTVGQPANCDLANITLTAAADAWVDEVNPTENFLFDQHLTVRSDLAGNARALVRFALPNDAPDCELEAATLRLYSDSATAGRTLQAVPLAGQFKENQVTWSDQPGTTGSPVSTASGDGYREWDVLNHVKGMIEAGQSHGWSIRDAAEGEEAGTDQSFASRELPQDPPEMTLPELVLLYKAAGGPPPAPPVPATEPTTVRCGQVLTASTLVANDLTNCPGEGLVIGAPNIVIDLGGHTIDGPDYLIENVSGQEEGFPPGIRNSGHTNVVIRNGTVQQFGWGVLLTSGTTANVVENLTVLRNAVSGVELFDADDGRTGNTVRNSTIADNELGVSLVGGSDNSLVENNAINGNLGEAVLIQFSRGHTIRGNRIHGIPSDPLLDSDGGILLDGASNNQLIGNTLHDTGDAGVIIHQGSHGNRVERQVFYRNGDAGVSISDSDRNQVIDIVAHQESDGGVVLNNANDTVVRGSDLRFNPSGVEASNSNNLVIEDNDASNSLQTGLAIGNGVNVRIVDNVANGTGGAGISMEGGAFDANGAPVGGALIQGNTTNQNRESGISVASGGHRIANNNAHNNAGHGIRAEDDAVDGGGNRASGNAETEQCVGVVCDTSGSVPLVPPDTTAPETTITVAPPNPTTSTSATFEFVSADAGTPATAMVFGCRLDPPPDPAPEIETPDPDPTGPNETPEPPEPPEPLPTEGWAECVSPIHFHDLEPGTHRFEVRTLDQADNRDLTAALYEWTIDLAAEGDETGPDPIAPDTRISAGPPATTDIDSATFRFSGSDNATPGSALRYQCRLDSQNDADFADCTSPKTYTGLGAGSHTFEVRALDRTGNPDPTPATYTWTFAPPPPDTTPPGTTISAGPDLTTVSTSATFTFSADEPAATLECSLDGAAFETCVSPKEYTSLTVREHEFRVRAKDAAGNADPTPASYVWTVGAAPVAAPVFCGQVLRQSTLVTNDLTECPGDGLVIGADRITVDLGGHIIDGKGLGSGVRNDGFDSVTVRNGSAVDFDYGVSLNVGTVLNIVESLTLETNQEAGIALGQPPAPEPNQPAPPPVSNSGVIDNTLRNNSVLANNRGIWLANGTKGTLARGNTVAASGGYGVWVENSSANRVEANEISASGAAGVALEGSGTNTVADNVLEGTNVGIVVGAQSLPSDDNRIEHNTIIESGGNAINVVESKDNLLIDNVANRSNGVGVYLYKARDTLVRGNDLRSNTVGISLDNSSANRLEANDSSESGGTGILVQSLSTSNVLLNNISGQNDGDGIYVGDETAGDSGTLIEGNTTNNNTSHGIFVPKVSHTIKNNVANDNGSWGIYASEGSNGRFNIDGGGNRAQGNVGPLDPMTLMPLQCFTIRCEGGPAPADPIPPETSIIEGPPDPSTDDVATFRFTGSDNASAVEFQCRLDSQDESDFVACLSPHTFSTSVGSHTFEVRAVDTSGNVDPTPATHSWTVESRPTGVPPETTIDSGPDLTTTRTDATFEFSANERDSTFECALDGAGFTPCALFSPSPFLAQGSISYTGLAVGAHEFRVRATDAEGNTDASPAVWSWRVAAAPVAAEVACGEILVRSTLVQNDLTDCPGHGLIIGAPDIVVDLDGHVIDGVGADSGILNNGFDAITVTNGTIREFDYGVALSPGTAHNLLSALRLELNQEAGIALSDADQGGNGNTVRGNTVVSNGFGIAVFSGTRNTVVRDNALGANTKDGVRIEHASGNRIEANEIATSGGAGVALVGGGDNTVVGNDLSGNGEGIAVGESQLPSNDNTVERNTVTASNGTGISVVESTGTQILLNVVRESNGAGVTLDLARDTLVRGNDLRSNTGGISLNESTGNVLEANNASGTLGTGIEIGALSFDNTVVRNTTSANAGEGIHVTDPAPSGAGNVVEANTADDNGGDGIAVDAAGHTVTANTVRRNGGWGIYAPAGASDGGGNAAAGNTESAQCLGVVCEIGMVPGAPDTSIVETPPLTSNSRGATFTYSGSDDTTPLQQLVFECRLDSTNELDWVDCEYPQEYDNLSPGRHTFEVRAVDLNLQADPTPAAYTWTYEPLPAGVAPQIVIDVKPEPETMQFEALFTFHANEPDVTLECKVDALAYEPCGFDTIADRSRGAYEAAFEETEVGPHTFFVRATDFEGNVGAPATYTWHIAGVVTSFLSGPGFTPGTEGEPATGGETGSTSATIDFIANVADATYECSLDLEPFAPCTPPVTYTGLSVGSHELLVIATDAEGVSELEPAVYEWEIIEQLDNTPPETSIDRAPANNSSSTIFEFSGTDDQTPPALVTFECRLDSTNELDWAACESPYNLLDFYTYQDFELAPGTHTFEVRAVDDAEPLVTDPANPNFDGNVDPTPATYTWTLVADTSPPGTGILTGPPARTGELAAEFTFFGTDNATPELRLTFECAVDGAAYAPCGSPESVQGLEPGDYTFRVRAVDLAGNSDPTPATRTWTLVPAPVTTITSAPPSPHTTENAVFVFSADQTGSTFECALDGVDFTPCTSPQAYWVFTDGGHLFEVRATNPEGIVGEPASYEFTTELGPDPTPPDTRITSGPNPSTPETVATFEFTGSDNRTPPGTLMFECALDGTAYNSCTSPEQFSDLTRGQHVLLVRAKDTAGNFDPTPARFEWTVAPPPETTILSGPEEMTESTTATFTFSADVPGSTFECWLDGVVTPCTSPQEYTGLAAGPHIFGVRATDPGGNKNPLYAEWEWEIGDVVPPITTIESGPDVQTETTSATFVFSANEPDVTFECALDGAAFAPCTSPHEYPRLHPGQHHFQVQALTPTLIVDPVATTYEWTIIDNTPPDTTISFGPPATTASLNAYFGFGSDDPTAVFECSLDGQGFNECTSPATYTELTRSGHLFQVRAVDPAGNADPTPATYSWTITAAPPPNTPTGTNVAVDILMPDGAGTATVTFAEVAIEGATTIDVIPGVAPLPSGYRQAGARFYDISTTAEFTEPVTVCLPYDPAAFNNPTVRLLHFDGSVWADLTVTNDPAAGRVCAEADTLSPFAITTASSGVAPETSIVSGPPNPSDSGTATFTFVADQPDALLQCSLDGAPFDGCSSPRTYTHLENGSHDFQVQAVNANGFADLTPALYEWEVVLPPDTTPPDTTITKGPPALTGNAIVEFQFTGSDDQTVDLDLEFRCALDGVALGSCSSPYEVEVLTFGEHRLEVQAIDVTGNVDPTPATHTWTLVDVTAPDTSIDVGPDSETEATTATFEFSGEEPDGTPVNEFECALDRADFATCTSPHTVDGLTVGSHVFQVRAKDPAGVVDSTPDMYEWTVLGPPDTTPPDTIIASAPPATSGPDVTFGFTSDEPVETFECALDGASFADCGAVHEIAGLASGEHELAVLALDPAGNVDPTPASYVWVVRGAPETTILSRPDDPSPSASAMFTFTSDQDESTFQCSVDGSEFVACTSPFTAGPLTNLETHVFEVRAVSPFRALDGTPIVDETPASYEWTVNVPPDGPLPDTAILSGPPAVTAGGPDAIFTFTFSSPTPNATFECALDGETFSECVPGVEYTGLAAGPHAFRVRAVDPAESVDPTPAVHEWTIEAAPETTIGAGPEATTESTEAVFTFSSPDPDVSFDCALDGAAFAPCVSPKTYSNVPFGEHEFLVRAKAPLGTVDETPAEYTWASGDMTPPVATILSAPEATTASTSATFTFSSDDPAAVFQCSLDGGPLTFCSSPQEYTGLTPGAPHTFEVVATKPHLLVDPEPAVHEWTIVDEAAPDTAITSGPAGTTGSTTATFAFTGTDNAPVADLQFECALDGTAFESCSSPHEVQGLVAGTHTFTVRAVDRTLNADPTPATATWTVVAAPETTIDSGPDASTASAAATFTFSADQAGSTFRCSLDGAPFEPCTSPHSVEAAADGGHVFEVQALNTDGILDETPARYEWTVALPPGATRPDTTILSGPEATSPSTAATFEFAADQPDATFQCSLDSGAFTTCTSPREYTDLAQGDHRFEVRATSTAGLTDLTAASYEWTIDLPPNTTIVSGPDAATVSTTASFAFSSNEPDVVYECALDGPSFGSCTSPVEFSDLTVGEHELQVRAKDTAGNVDASPATFRWTVEPLPETTIVSGPTDPTESAEATFTFTSDQSGAAFECALDDQASYSACESGITYNGLTLGEHDFFVRAKDTAGNLDPTPATYSWEIGDIPPPVTIESGPPATTESTSATFAFSANEPGTTYECSLDSAAFAACASPKTYSGLPLGDHTFAVRAFSVDPVVEPPIATYTWTVADLTPPETAIDVRPAVTTIDTTAVFAFSTGETGATFECSLDNAAFAVCTSPVQYTDLALGEHRFAVRAVDAAGNADATPESHTWTVELPDCGDPVTAAADADSWIDNGSASTNKGTDSIVKVMSKGPSLDVRGLVRFSNPTMPEGCVVQSATLRLYAGAYKEGRTLQALQVDEAWAENQVTWSNQPPTTGPAATTASGPGYREWNVASQVQEMYDAGANNGFLIRDAVEGADAEQQFNSREKGLDVPQLVIAFGPPDRTPPETTIGAGAPAATTTSTSAAFSFSSNEPGSTFECSMDGAAFTACNSPKEYTGLAVGTHEFRVRATDAAGNVDATPAAHQWVIEADTTAPETTLGSGAPAATTTSTSAAFSFSADEQGSTFECSLDEAAFAACVSPKEYTSLAVGAHEFRVRAKDVAGNTDGSPAIHSWTIAPNCSTVTAAADRDTWMLQSSGTSNFGTDSILKVDSKSGGNARALVRFGLPAIPFGCQVTSATLRLYSSSYKEGRTLNALRVTGSWTESGVTWNNQPSTTTTSSASAPSRTSAGYVEWTVTSQVQSMYSGSNNGFLIGDSAEGGGGLEQAFHSREKGADNPPQLVITFG